MELHWESLIHRSLNSFSLSFHNFLFFNFQIPILIFISEISAWRLVFWNSIHMEVASDSFCFLVYSSWLLVFILYVFELFFSFINLYCWKGLHRSFTFESWSLQIIGFHRSLAQCWMIRDFRLNGESCLGL